MCLFDYDFNERTFLFRSSLRQSISLFLAPDHFGYVCIMKMMREKKKKNVCVINERTTEQLKQLTHTRCVFQVSRRFSLCYEFFGFSSPLFVY